MGNKYIILPKKEYLKYSFSLIIVLNGKFLSIFSYFWIVTQSEWRIITQLCDKAYFLIIHDAGIIPEQLKMDLYYTFLGST